MRFNTQVPLGVSQNIDDLQLYELRNMAHRAVIYSCPVKSVDKYYSTAMFMQQVEFDMSDSLCFYAVLEVDQQIHLLKMRLQ